MTATPTGDSGIGKDAPGPAGRKARRRRFLWPAAGVGLVALAASAWVSIHSADAGSVVC